MRNTLSPLRYPGGKACLVPFLGEVIEKNKLSAGTFVEPFAGSAAAAIHLLVGEHVERIAINDFDYNIFCFWWAVLHRSDDLIDLFDSTPITVENWRMQQAIYARPGRLSKVRVGFATLFLNRCNRSGILVSAGPIGGYQQTGKWRIDARFDRKAIINQIQRIAAFQTRIEVHNRDGIEFLQRIIGRRSSVRETLVFLDPPYFEKGDRLYKTDFDYRKHYRLSKHLLSSASYPWALTYDRNAVSQKLYRSRKPIGYNLPYAAYDSRAGAEILVRSPRLKVDTNYLPGGASCY